MVELVVIPVPRLPLPRPKIGFDLDELVGDGSFDW